MENSLKNVLIIKILVGVIVLLVLSGGIYLYVNRSSKLSNNSDVNGVIVGNDKDVHGCIGSAGYSWCEVKNKCLRTWEEKCETGTTITKTTTTPAPKTTTTTSVSNVSSKCGFTVTSPLPGAKVSFPLTIKGVIDNSKSASLGCSWNQVLSKGGSAQLFYNLNNAGWISPGIPTNITTGTGSTASTTAFTVPLNMYTTNFGLKSGTPLKVTFTELNEINDKNPDSFDMYFYLK